MKSQMAGLGAAVAGAAFIGRFAKPLSHGRPCILLRVRILIAGGIIHVVGARDMRLMGGLRRTMPISLILIKIMIITISGLPPSLPSLAKA